VSTIYERINQIAERRKREHHARAADAVLRHVFDHPPTRLSFARGADGKRLRYRNWGTERGGYNNCLIIKRCGAHWWELPSLWLGFGSGRSDTERAALFNVMADAMGMGYVREYADVGDARILPNVINRITTIRALREAGYR
jgi:hypothetical protein